MTECRQQKLAFQGLGERRVEADFDGGFLSTDGGGLLLREWEKKINLIEALSTCFVDGRDHRYVDHSVQELLAQRVFGLALGYEDLNDHDRLRLDPLLAVMVGKVDPLAGQARTEGEGQPALAAHSTLNRLELGAHKEPDRYHKISARADGIEDCILEQGVRAIPRRTREIVLDFDATDDPLHGDQEGRFFQGYYRHYCYLPLYCFCGQIPLWAQLRTSQCDASEGTTEALEKIVGAIRRRFGRQVRIIVRADSGFARDPIMSLCESLPNVYYCIGLARNERLQRHIEELMEQVREENDGEGARAFCQFTWRTLDSWSRSRRVIAKAEVLDKGDNPRFIVTSLPEEGFADDAHAGRFEARCCYERFYCARGDMENRIKEQQLDMFADRTSSHWMATNQLRLWLSTVAYMFVATLRAEVLKATPLAHATVGSIRLKLLKIAAVVRVSVRRIHVRFASACPYQTLFREVLQRIQAFTSA